MTEKSDKDTLWKDLKATMANISRRDSGADEVKPKV